MEQNFKSKNDIDIFYYPGRHTHSFCLSLFIKAGVLYEEEKQCGITHFLEHILFRNINHQMDGKMYKTLDRAGLYFNGATYKEFTELLIIGSPKHFDEAADILLKTFQPITLPAAEVKTEQQRVKAEIREAEDFKSLDYFAGTHVWKDTGLKNPILGSKGTVNTFNKSRIAEYHKQTFTKENVFFYITGDVSDEMVNSFKEKVSELEIPSAAESGTKARFNLAPVPADFGKRNLPVHVKNSRYTMVQFSYDFVTDRYTAAELAVLYDMLFSGENSLIHQELSEKRGMIYSYNSALEKYNNIGRLFFTYEVSSRELYDSVEIVGNALNELGETVEERLPLVLADYVDNAYLVYDDNEGFGWQRAYETHIMEDESRSIEETKAAFEAVTPQRIREMAKEIFTPDNLVLSLKADKKKTDTERLRGILTHCFRNRDE